MALNRNTNLKKARSLFKQLYFHEFENSKEKRVPRAFIYTERNRGQNIYILVSIYKDISIHIRHISVAVKTIIVTA